MRAHSGRHLQNHCPSPADHNNERPQQLMLTLPQTYYRWFRTKKTRPIHFAGRNGIPTATVFLRQSQQISIICVSEKRKGPFNLSLSACCLGHLPKRLQIQIKLPQNEFSTLFTGNLSFPPFSFRSKLQEGKKKNVFLILLFHFRGL